MQTFLKDLSQIEHNSLLDCFQKQRESKVHRRYSKCMMNLMIERKEMSRG